MNKAVLMAIQPYWVFLIIAKAMGWNIPQEKTVEVRKNFPKDTAWNKRTHIYCSKDKKSFNRIPKEYQPLMEKFLGKVIGEFVCLQLEKFPVGSLRCDDIEELACLTYKEMLDYSYKPNELDGKTVKFSYGWHISDLKIYDTPKELREFIYPCKKEKQDYNADESCKGCKYAFKGMTSGEIYCDRAVLTSPQSWCYVEKI